MNEKVDKVVQDHFETKGIDVGRHKDDVLAREVADDVNTSPTWNSNPSSSEHPLVSQFLEKEAVAEMAAGQKDLPVQETTQGKSIHDDVQWGEISNSPHGTEYLERADKVAHDYHDISNQAHDMAKAAQAAKDLSKTSNE